MSTRNTVQSDRCGGDGNAFYTRFASVSPGTRDLGNVKNHLFYKVSLCFGVTFQIAFEKYTFLNRFEKYLGS